MTLELENNFDFFEVRQSRKLLFLISAILFAILIGFLNTVSVGLNNFLPVFIFLTAMCVAAFIGGLHNSTIIRVDYSGFYYRKTLICDWKSFESAFLGHEFYQSGRSLAVHERYYIIVYYYNQDNQRYQLKINMSETQDKSEEEIMCAIEEFARKYRRTG
ncbi:MAG: hypothetical protein EOP48_13595 [Sphingobacteriales bacterium]|nr:MAG: hypothetical protein EOP48_13595 [Sphingobacteriales bacterium]